MYYLKSLLNKLSATSPKREAQSISKAYIYGQKQAVWTERNYRKFASESYSKNVIAYRCISMISQAAASVPFKLYNVTEQKWHVVRSHPLLNLLNKPNSTQSCKEL